MKTIYSLKEFYDLVNELAAKKGETYVSVRTEFASHSGLVFGCYVHGFNWYTAPTMQGSIDKLHAAMFPKPEKALNDDVEIEVETEETQPA